MIQDIYFLTTNAQKAADAARLGLASKAFELEIPEVLSPNVEEVVLYKAKDTGLDNVIVEDTSLDVEEADFLGTEIKHVYEEIKNNDFYHDRRATWRVSLCFKHNDNYYISTGELNGRLRYPALEYGYHFNRIFTLLHKGERHYFEDLPEAVKMERGPRFIALKKLTDALNSNDFSSLRQIPAAEVKDWAGEYQVETTQAKKQMKLF